jgi:hypothetical protein
MACQAQRSNKRTKTIVPPEGVKILKVFPCTQPNKNIGSEVALLKSNITLRVQRFIICFEDECVNYG